MKDNFYVYEHWRLDRDECFYVGKGRGKRAYSRKGRNNHWNNIVSKLERLGSGYEVKLVAVGLSEDDAFYLERERIIFWRDITDLANITEGGEGLSGYKHSEETKKHWSTIRKGKNKGNTFNLGKKRTQESRDKISKALKGKKTNSEETRVKLSKALKGRVSTFLGKKHSPETLTKMSAIKKGKKASDETRAKMSLVHKNRWAKIKEGVQS